MRPARAKATTSGGDIKVIGAHFGVDAAFKIPIAGKHRRHYQIFFIDRLRNFLGQGPGVPDAGGASVANDVEFYFFEIRQQPGFLQIVAHHLGARRQRSLYPGRNGQSFLHRLFGDQPGCHHHGWIRSVGAGGDGGDHYAAMAQRFLHVRRNVFFELMVIDADGGGAAAFLLPAVHLFRNAS